MSGSVVLIITNFNDVHADKVIEQLNDLSVPVVRWHPSETLSNGIITMNKDKTEVHISSSGLSFSLNDLRSVWLRKPKFVDPSLSPIRKHPLVERFDVLEAEMSVRTIYQSIDSVWYSNPENMRRAESKLFQLAVATKLGFLVPDYLVSQDGSSLYAFAQKYESVIMKPIDSISAGVKDSRFDEMILSPTTKVSLDALKPLANLRLEAPALVQQHIRKAFDVRVTVIGKEAFPVAILTDESESVDTRVHWLKSEHRVIEFPPVVRDLIFAFQNYYQLNFGAFDFAVDREGRWWFLECNAYGQFLWKDLKTDLNLARVMAEHLALMKPALVV